MRNRISKKCRCPLWATGTLEGKNYRRSLKTRSFERAEQIKREIENGKRPQPLKNISVKDALTAWLKDGEQRNLSRGTRRKYSRVAERCKEGFGETTAIRDIDSNRVRDFREGWKLAPLTASKELGFLRAFFAFCISNDWLTKNPAKSIKAPQVKTIPRIPFTEKEIQNITSQAKEDRELAFLLVLRHTGLRIGDASLLHTTQLSDNRIHLYTTKAGTPVSILIPETLVSLLKKLPPKGGYFFLRGESLHPHSTSDSWRKRIKAICKALKITPDHPHRFRHSLAAELLTKGVSVENVAAILGNSPAIVARHYSQWIQSRQDALDVALQSIWKPSLVRVK